MSADHCSGLIVPLTQLGVQFWSDLSHGRWHEVRNLLEEEVVHNWHSHVQHGCDCFIRLLKNFQEMAPDQSFKLFELSVEEATKMVCFRARRTANSTGCDFSAKFRLSLTSANLQSYMGDADAPTLKIAEMWLSEGFLTEQEWSAFISEESFLREMLGNKLAGMTAEQLMGGAPPSPMFGIGPSSPTTTSMSTSTQSLVSATSPSPSMEDINPPRQRFDLMQKQRPTLEKHLHLMRMSDTGTPHIFIKDSEFLPQRVRVNEFLDVTVEIKNYPNPQCLEVLGFLLDRDMNVVDGSSASTTSSSSKKKSKTPVVTALSDGSPIPIKKELLSVKAESASPLTSPMVQYLDEQDPPHILARAWFNEQGEASFGSFRISTSSGARTNYFHIGFRLAINPSVFCLSSPLKVFVENTTREKAAQREVDTQEKLDVIKVFPPKIGRGSKRPVLILGEHFYLKPYRSLVVRFKDADKPDGETFLLKEPDVRFENPRLIRIVNPPVFATARVVNVKVSHHDTAFPGAGFNVIYYSQPKDELLCASFNGLVSVMENCFKDGATVTVTDKEGRTALHWSSVSGSNDAVEFLMSKGADLNAQDDNGDTPVHLAVQTEQWNAASTLLEGGADVNVRNTSGQTVLHQLAMTPCKKRKLVDTVVENSFDVGSSDIYGMRPLQYATQTDNYPLVQAMIMKERGLSGALPPMPAFLDLDDMTGTMDDLTRNLFVDGLASQTDSMPSSPDTGGHLALSDLSIGTDPYSMVEALKNYYNNPQVLSYVCYLMRQNANTQEARRAIANLGAISCLLQIMDTQYVNESLLAAASGALYKLTSTPELRDIVLENNGVAVLLRTLRYLAGTRPVSLLKALLKLTNEHSTCSSIVIQGGVKVVCEVMRQRADDVKSLQLCCAILKALCEADSQSIKGEDVIAPILTAMKQHPTISQIQSHGAQSLKILASTDKSNQFEVVVQGGIATLLDAVKTHTDNTAVQIQACMALSTVATTPGFHEFIGRCNNDPFLQPFLRVILGSGA
eukprot:TRINITY_DN5306_c0_g3_i1.p1 TRINITY_DN5306_c0_g3~~TRINITY_DN5306_c0_g3_i1.p1  ORF type:complete len:1018 (-),score=250.99 TRINITY_DN5306_c0_g3_i1:40-3093(-)